MTDRRGSGRPVSDDRLAGELSHGAWRHALITGASSGLGAALARHLSWSGRHLTLVGRNATRLAAVADAVAAAGARTTIACADVTDGAAMAEAIAAADQRAPLDLVIANAGISAGTGGVMAADTALRGAAVLEGPAQAKAIFATNLDGVVNTALPALAAMQPRRRGQLALMASLAGYRGLAGAPAYCASKAAVIAYGEALRGLVAADGLGVTVICPGFVRTPMTAVNDFPMPFLMDSDRAAALILRRLARNPARIAFPLPLAVLVWALRAMPAGLADRLTRTLPAKRAVSSGDNTG